MKPNPVVAAIGLAATRDWVSFLRRGTAAQGNPLAGDVLHTFSYSISQPTYTDGTRTAIRLLPSGTPFQRSWIYEFTYTAKNPVVAAIGLAATRDWVSFLRRGTAA